MFSYAFLAGLFIKNISSNGQFNWRIFYRARYILTVLYANYAAGLMAPLPIISFREK